jgi:hypothetical protein
MTDSTTARLHPRRPEHRGRQHRGVRQQAVHFRGHVREEGNAGGKPEVPVLVVLDVKVILTPLSIFHQLFSIQKY